jgi:hypothetical protein
MHKAITILTFWLCIQASYSQHITWQSCYGSSNGEKPSDLLKTKSGFILSTIIHDNEMQIPGYQGGIDACLIGLDTTGNFLWHRCYGGSKQDGFNKTLQNTDNTYYVLGYSQSDDGDLNTPIHGLSDSWLVKLDSNFNIIWQRTFGSPSTEQFRDAVLTSDGGLLVLSRVSIAGYNVSVVYGPSDLWVCKFSPDGELEWEKTIGNYYNDNALSLRKTSRKDLDTYYIIGSSEHGGGMVECRKSDDFDQDVIVYEIDREGNLLRQFCYGGSQSDLGYDILPLKDGFIFCASTRSNDMDVSGNHGGVGDIWIVRCDTSGAILWQKCYGGSDGDCPAYMDTAQNGSYVVIGYSYSSDGDVLGQHGVAQADVWVLSVDSVGTLLSSQCFGSTGHEYPWQKTVVRNGNHSYTISVGAQYNNGDIECLPFPCQYFDCKDDIWTFNVKFCEGIYASPPARPMGPHVVCTSLTPQSTYYVHPAALAQTYEWHIHPSEAGTAEQQDTTMTLSWAPGFEGVVALRARAVNECGPSEWSVFHWADVQTCIGMTEPAQGSIRLWPNPATDMLNVELPASVQLPLRLTLIDLTGRVLLSHEISQPHSVISLSGLPRGAYFCRLASREINVTAKIIKGL